MPSIETTSDTTPNLRQRINQLANFVHNPGAHEILAEGTIHPARALVIRAILATPGLPKFLHDMTNATQYRRAGFDVLGVGYHAVTVSDGSEKVRKFYRHTSDMSEAEQTAQMNDWNAKQSLILEHLGMYAVPQNFDIDAHPLDPNKSLVVATQDRIIPAGVINIFEPDSIPESAREFLARSQAMPTTGAIVAVPDLIGHENAVVEATTGAIKLVDPIALVRDDPSDTAGYDRVVRRLEQNDAQWNDI